MPSPESFDELEQKVEGLVEEAIQEVRSIYLQRLQNARDILDQLLSHERRPETEPAPLAEEVEPSEEPAAAPVTESIEVLPPRMAAVAAGDRCRSQTGILNALLHGGGHFASRTALFLTREEGLQGWGSQGFVDAAVGIDEVSVAYGEDTPWSLLAAGSGVVQLSKADCTDLCSHLDGSSPQAGVLIPIVLRDRIAAALYADQLDGDQELSTSALQLLSYIAAQALETLPLRERTSTGTLRFAEEADEEEPKLALWQFAVPLKEAEVVEPELEEEAEDLYAAEVTEPVSTEAEGVEVELDWPTEEAAVLAEEPDVVVETTVEEIEEEFEAVAEEPEAELEEIAEEEAPDVVVEAAVEEIEEEFEPVAEEPEAELEEIAEEYAEVPAELEAEEVTADEAWGAAEVAEEPIAETVEEVELEAEPDYVAVEDSGFAVEPAVEIDMEEEVAVVEAEPAYPEVEEVAAEPVAAPEPEIEAAPEPVPEVAEAPEEPAVPSYESAPPPQVAAETEIMPPAGAEIQPPQDLQGPGWAFSTNRLAEGDEEAVHEEARRLARLLVTEIKLYNEEQVEEGRRTGNIYGALREDIDRSRQIYEERIDENIREDTDYFRDELVRILAGGDADALGT
jgi:hypothetical protein